MNTSAFNQFSETRQLKQVILGRHKGYAAHEAYVEIVNEEQKKGLPSSQQLQKEFDHCRAVLEDHGVEVLIPDYVGKFVYDQLTPRDIGVVIGNKFVACPMLNSSRKYEIAGIFKYLNEKEDHEPNVLIPGGRDITLEGGDIIVDHPYIFVGISQRSNKAGYQYLQRHFSGDFEVVEVHCKPLNEGENVLHLDCIFNPVGTQHALIYPGGFVEVPKQIQGNYKLLEITRKEQEALATNILSIDENTVLARFHPDCQRVNEVLRSNGLEVIELPFDAAPATGGSFRCCTLPLVRRCKV